MSLHPSAPLGPFSPATREREDLIIRQAISLLERRIFVSGRKLSCPSDVTDYLRLKLAGEPSEVVSAIFLNTQHAVLAFETLFRGTIDSATVHPRVVVQRALFLNAGAVILAHQHPSGNTDPSSADKCMTHQIRTALETFDIRLLDHFIIGEGTPFSFADAHLL